MSRYEYSTPSQFYKHTQADMLAAAILMPKDVTVRAWRSCLDVESMAEIFQVPMDCVIIRLGMLGIKV